MMQKNESKSGGDGKDTTERMDSRYETKEYLLQLMTLLIVLIVKDECGFYHSYHSHSSFIPFLASLHCAFKCIIFYLAT